MLLEALQEWNGSISQELRDSHMANLKKRHGA